MERPRLAGSPKRKIYKRDNTALKSVCQGEMCGKMHFQTSLHRHLTSMMQKTYLQHHIPFLAKAIMLKKWK